MGLTQEELARRAQTRGFMLRLSYQAKMAQPTIWRLCKGIGSPRLTTWRRVEEAVKALDAEDKAAEKVAKKKGGRKQCQPQL